MKRLLCAVAAIALFAPQIASAQPRDRQRDQTTTTQRVNRNGHTITRTTRVRRNGTRAVTRTNAGPNRTVRTRTVTRTNPNTGRTRVTTTRNVYRIGHRPTTYHRIRARRFVYPRGYSYRHWAIGAVLPRIFLGPTYYWTDWAALGLLPPPPGYVWVRFGPDLLLVNRYTGRIADVIYGAFY